MKSNKKKLFLFATLATLFFSQSQRAFADSRDGHHTDGHPDIQVNFVATDPIYRFYGQGHHFLTLNYNEGINAGYRYEGIAFSVLHQPSWGTVPLFRCVVPGNNDHYVSRDPGCENPQFRNEGIYGFVMETGNREALTPIYRCYSNGDHLTTRTPEECNIAHYNVEGIQGYVP